MAGTTGSKERLGSTSNLPAGRAEPVPSRRSGIMQLPQTDGFSAPPALPKRPPPIDRALGEFQPVRSRPLRIVLQALPWAALALAAAIGVIDYGTTSKTGLALPGWTMLALSAAAAGGFLILRLLNCLTGAMAGIWDRDVLESVGSARKEELGSEYASFIRRLQKSLNSRPGSCVMAATFMVLIFFTFPGSGERAEDVSLASPFSPINMPIILVAGLVGTLGWRMLAVALGVHRMSRDFNFRIHPHHPDRSGGLKPLGDICLTIALIIAIPGIYVALRILDDPDAPDTQFLTAVFLPAVVLLAALAFLRPLYSVHLAMQRRVEPLPGLLDSLAREANRLAFELLYTSHQISSAAIEEKRKKHALLLQVYDENKRLPTWPFARVHVLTFASSQILPLMGIAVPLVVQVFTI